MPARDTGNPRATLNAALSTSTPPTIPRREDAFGFHGICAPRQMPPPPSVEGSSSLMTLGERICGRSTGARLGTVVFGLGGRLGGGKFWRGEGVTGWVVGVGVGVGGSVASPPSELPVGDAKEGVRPLPAIVEPLGYMRVASPTVVGAFGVNDWSCRSPVETGRAIRVPSPSRGVR